MDLSTRYLGLSLRSPLVASASPLTQDVDAIQRLAEHGAAAVVLPSLFEEQLLADADELDRALSQGAESFAEAQSYFPAVDDYRVGSDDYLELIRAAKQAVDIPVIASLNGANPGSWVGFAAQMAEAGADAIELNVYKVPTDFDQPGSALEQEVVEILKGVKAAVQVPVAVKLSPFFSNLAHTARQLDAAGADGLVLFNRFYQPDIDLEQLEVTPNLQLSQQVDMRLPLRWIGILAGRVEADLAATSGVHQADDVIKLTLVGAKVAMLCSSLLQQGTGHLAEIERDLTSWLERHEYESLAQAQGSMSQTKLGSPALYERAQYTKALHSYAR